MLEPRHHPGVVAVSGILYVVGGYTQTGAASTTLFAFDPATQRWSTRRPLPTARAAHATVELNGKTYALGGVRGAVLDSNEMYDPATDSWSVLAPMPTPREHLAAAVIDQLIYVVGGGLAAAALGGRLFVFGGENPGVFPHTEEFDPRTGRWRRVADLLAPRHGMSAVTVGAAIHVIGGGIRAGFGASSAHEVFRR